MSSSHQWVVAATVDLNDSLARQAFRRGTVRVPAEIPTNGVPSLKVDVLDVYCGACRRPWEAVHEQSCAAAENKDHLIGGPTGERKKRRAFGEAEAG